jgi:tetratricopeptide (TPR) repeat protein
MSEPDSIHVLFKAARRKDAPNEAESNAVTELAGILGGLPLALVHAGNYCDTSKITFSEYLERFQLYRSKLMTMEPPLQLDKYSYSTYTSIKLSYSLLGEQARGLLHLLAFFHPSSIHLDILRAASKHRYQPDREDMLLPWDDQHDGAVDALRRLLIPDDSWDIYMDLLLNQLQSFSLITVSHSGDHQTITIHTLVQSCVLDTLSLDVFSHYFSMTVLVLSGCSHDEERAIFQHLSVHITELESRKMTIHPNHLSAFAYIMFINGNYEESMRIREKVRDECRRVNGDEDISTLRVSYRIATCHWRLQRLAEAEELIRRVMKAQKRVLGDDNDEVLLSYRLLAHILRDLQQTEEAEKILMRLLALHMIKYGQEHSKTLSTQLSIVTNLHTQKRYSEAEALSRYILPIMTEVLREGDAITLYTSNILSLALMGQEKWAEAGAILSGLVVKTTTLRGKHHPNTLMFQFNHTQYLIYQENLDEAKGILQYIVGVQEKVLGMNHTHTVESRNRLQNVIRAQKARLLSNIIPPRPPSIVNSSLKSTREFVRFNHLWHIFLLLFNPERTPGLEGVEIALEARGLPWSGVLATLAAVAVPFVLLRSLASLFSL